MIRWLPAALGTSVLVLAAAASLRLAWDEVGVAGAAAGEVVTAPAVAGLEEADGTAPRPTGTARREGRVRRPERFYEAIEARPLFAPTRRPVEAAPEGEEEIVLEPEVMEEAAPTALDAALKGVMTGGASAKALLAFEDGAPEWLAVGSTHAGWTLAEVDAGHVVLAREGERVRLEIAR